MNTKEKALMHIENIRTQLTSKGYYLEPTVEKNFHYEMHVIVSQNKFKVLVYFGKKGVKTVIQGNSKEPAYDEINYIINPQSALDFPEEVLIEPEEYIGTDETGKGDVFGPLVAAAVYVDSKLKTELRSIGVKDSKTLSPAQIKIIAGKIKTLAKGKYDIVSINPEKYNELYAKFKNLNKLLNWAHSKAAENLIIKTNCETVITDKFSKEYLNFSKDVDHLNIKLISETKAEKYTAVAAASILARDKMESWFAEMSKGGVDLPKGASNNIESTVLKLIKKEGSQYLKKVSKIHFKSIQKLIKI